MNKTYAISMFIVSLSFFVGDLVDLDKKNITIYLILKIVFWFLVMLYMVFGYLSILKKQKNKNNL
ncbi:hypothetical protein [Polaribacter sp.]|uniref:hypothetical protein n=1 Tax=Polaribacter sp. TaxID=1920175 RepID=UPI003F6C1491